MAKRLTWKSCLLGCGLFAVAFIVLAIAVGLWLTGKGSFETERTVLSPTARFYARINLERENEPLVEFLAHQLRAVNQASQGDVNLPLFLENWRDREGRNDLLKMLPLEAEIVGVDEDAPNVAVGFSLYNNMAKIGWFFLKRDARKSGDLWSHGDVEYVRFKGEAGAFGPFFTLHRNTLFFARSHEAMTAMLDRFHAPVQLAEEDVAPEDPRMAGVDRDAPIYAFALEPSRGPAREMLDDSLPGQENAFWEAFTRIGFDLSLDGPDAVRGALVFEAREPGPSLKSALERALAHAAAETPLDMTFEVAETAYGYRADYRATGFEAWSREQADQR